MAAAQLQNATASYRNLVDLVEKSVAKYDARPLFGSRLPDGSWDWITYREFGSQVDAFRAGLASLGVGAGDRVAVIADNRVEWAVGAYAVYGLGAYYAPMYQKQNPADWEYILRDSGAKVVLVANSKIASTTRAFVGQIDTLQAVVDFEGAATDPTSYKSLLATGRQKPVPSAQPAPDELCGFIYTSGTTGKPKGVMLTHGNIISNVDAIQQLFPMRQDDRSLSFLPWAHSFGQTCELHMLISFGASMAICDNVDKLVDYLQDVKPTLLFSVPRVFNRVYDRLNKSLAEGSPLKRKLFLAGMRNSSARRTLAARGETSGILELKHKFFDKIVFSKVRARLGGQLRYAFSGGAAISKEVAEFIDNVGITVYEGYGLSETSPIATANAPGHQRIGSVGKAIPGVQIIIDTSKVDDPSTGQGEILIKGPNVMKGYYHLDQETAEVMGADGSFRSGDLGYKDADGYVYITGRIKEQYKLENGKYVAPAPLEEKLKLSGFINQVMVYGDNKPYNVALVVPDMESLNDWAKKNGVTGDSNALMAHPKVLELMGQEIEKYSSDFKGFDRVRNFVCVPEEFTTDNDMLTPSMKVKRRNVLKAYQGKLDALYSEKPRL